MAPPLGLLIADNIGGTPRHKCDVSGGNSPPALARWLATPAPQQNSQLPRRRGRRRQPDQLSRISFVLGRRRSASAAVVFVHRAAQTSANRDVAPTGAPDTLGAGLLLRVYRHLLWGDDFTLAEVGTSLDLQHRDRPRWLAEQATRALHSNCRLPRSNLRNQPLLWWHLSLFGGPPPQSFFTGCRLLEHYRHTGPEFGDRHGSRRKVYL